MPRNLQDGLQALEGDILRMTRLLASKPDEEPKSAGQTEFRFRDIVHQIGGKAILAELDDEKSYQGSSMICSCCGEVATFKEHRDKSFILPLLG